MLVRVIRTPSTTNKKQNNRIQKTGVTKKKKGFGVYLGVVHDNYAYANYPKFII
jgi:hypothetical protein